MKRKIYTPLLLTALFMSTLSQTVPGTTANAAKKPALSKTKISVYTGKKAKISIKKIAKKTKVTWKLGNKKVAKIVKQKKTGKPYAVIQGAKKGKTTLLARYKQGKKIRKLTCRITVLAAKKLHHKKCGCPIQYGFAFADTKQGSRYNTDCSANRHSYPDMGYYLGYSRRKMRCYIQRNASNCFKRFYSKTGY